MTNLKLSAKRSIRKMAQLNDDVNIERMTNYYIVVDQFKRGELSPITKAKIAVENKKAAGQFDELNKPIKFTYQPDPEITELQNEIEKITAA